MGLVYNTKVYFYMEIFNMDLKKTLTMPKGKFPMRANLPSWEGDMAKSWDSIDLYQKLLEAHDGKDPFYLHDGPPYANNEIHAGHALNKIIKDIIIRSKNLEGYYVPYTPGWDTHGLPIENCVTKMGVDRRTTSAGDFRKKCREYALTQVDKQRGQMLRLGVIGDYHHPYLTLDREYEVNQVKIFKKMAMDGLIYKGLKPVIWSWSSESALAEAEVEYKDVKATTIYFRFLVVDGKGILSKEDYFLVWTTTGWTIPSNQGLCLNPNMEYGLYETDKGNYVMIKSLAEKMKEEVNFSYIKLLKSFIGKDLEGIKVSHPYQDRQVPVCVDEYVTDDSGTGIVHLGPGHGADDYRVGKKYGLPIICTVDSKGYMIDAGDEVNGLFYEDCSTKVIEILKENGNLLVTKDLVHAYPHDWRTKKPVIFRATAQWFCSVSKIKDKLIQAAEDVKYKPSWGKVRFENMLTGRDDWCISRQRLWGVPIPIFYGEDDEAILDEKLFDHVEKLFLEYGSDIWYEKDVYELLPEGYTSPHSPNGKFTKEKDIMDVWFDSGSSFLGSDIALSHPFPADIYFEGNDQYRGWYNSSMILSVAYTGISPYKQILTHGFIVDQNGEKFSKSKKNGIDPVTICNQFGADILRLWTTSIDYTTAEIKLSPDLLKVCSDQYRKIRNTFKFMITNLDDDDLGNRYDINYKLTELSLIDSMMMNKLKVVLVDMKRGYDNYDFASVTSIITNFFVNDLSSFYLDFKKDTLYCEGVNSKLRRDTQYVLYSIIKSLAIAYSPILSFTCEEIYRTIDIADRKESIALEAYPDLGAIDESLLSTYKLFLAFRDNVNAIIEPIRKEGTIGSSSEASITYLPVSEEEKNMLNLFSTLEIQTVLQVSKFAVGNKNEVIKHSGYKCERCWNYFDEIEEDDEHHSVCHRCHEVIKDIKVEE